MKKQHCVSIFGLLLFVQAAGNCYSQGNSAMENKKLVMSWIQAINKHDTNAIGAYYDDRAQLESPNWEGTKTGKQAAMEIYGRYFLSTPDLRYELSNLIITDSALVVEYMSYGTLMNLEKNTPAYMRGKQYALKNCTRMDMRNGKIMKQASYFDQVAFLRQMGFFDR